MTDPEILEEVTVNGIDGEWVGKFRGRDKTDPERVYVQKTKVITVNVHASKVEGVPVDQEGGEQ